MDRKDTGANFQIVVDGKSLSHRDSRETALEPGVFLEERHPQSEIVARDLKSGAQTVIGWKNGKAFSGLGSAARPAPPLNSFCRGRPPPQQSRSRKAGESGLG